MNTITLPNGLEVPANYFGKPEDLKQRVKGDSKLLKYGIDRGRAKAFKELKEELQKYSGDYGNEYFAQRDFDFICKIMEELKKKESKWRY